MKRYEEYKDSGVQWLGEIPGHWETRRLGGFFTSNPEINTDFNYKHAYKFNYGSIVYKEEIGNENEYREVYEKYAIVEKNDIMINGLNLNYDFVSQRVAIVPETGIMTSAYLVLRPKPTVVPMYYCYLFKAMDSMKLFHGMGTGIRLTLTFKEVKKQIIPLPPLPEQQAIVSFLDTKTSQIDTYIAGKEKEIDLLKSTKQRIIADAVTKGITPGLKMKDSGITWVGKIPAHWQEKRLGGYFTSNPEINSDFTYKHAYKFNYGNIVLKNEIGNEDEYREVYEKYAIVEKNDIMINGLNLNYDFVSQRVAIVPDPGIITSAYLVLRPRPTIDPMYFCFLFKAMDSMRLFHGMGTGIRLTLTFKEVRKQILPIPPLSEQQSIVAYIKEKSEAIDSAIEKLTTQIELMKKYKQRLISDVVTGQIKVC